MVGWRADEEERKKQEKVVFRERKEEKKERRKCVALYKSLQVPHLLNMFARRGPTFHKTSLVLFSPQNSKVFCQGHEKYFSLISQYWVFLTHILEMCPSSFSFCHFLLGFTTLLFPLMQCLFRNKPLSKAVLYNREESPFPLYSSGMWTCANIVKE